MLYKQKDDMINALNEGKEELNRLSLQNQNVQNKAFTLLEKCFNDTASLRYQIMDLKKEALDLENIKKEQVINTPKPFPKPPKDRFCNIF